MAVMAIPGTVIIPLVDTMTDTNGGTTVGKKEGTIVGTVAITRYP